MKQTINNRVNVTKRMYVGMEEHIFPVHFKRGKNIGRKCNRSNARMCISVWLNFNWPELDDKSKSDNALMCLNRLYNPTRFGIWQEETQICYQGPNETKRKRGILVKDLISSKFANKKKQG